MLSYLKWMLPVTAAMGLLIGISTLSANADDAKKGTISGTVVDKDGKGVAGADVAVTKPPAGRAGKQGAPAAAAKQADEPKAGKAAKKKAAEALFKATTDADGKFTIKDVPAGEYRVSATLAGKSHGAENVTVTDGTATVTISLKDTPPKKKDKAAK
jgi:hypothetical protein